MPNGENPFSDYLSTQLGGNIWSMLGPTAVEQDPMIAYYSSPAGQAFTQTPASGAYSPRRGRYRQQAFQDVYSDYLGELGTAMRAGQPGGTFTQFLETDPWTRRYAQLPQYERGVTGAYSNPRTRFIYY